eukprot:4072391-Pyramimonas_sp.AAC.1
MAHEVFLALETRGSLAYGGNAASALERRAEQAYCKSTTNAADPSFTLQCYWIRRRHRGAP